MAVGSGGGPDLFKEEFKRYKRRSPPADLSDVIDPRYPERFSGEISEVACGQANGRQDKRAAVLGLRPLRQWKIYQFTSVPGLLLIPNPFQDGCQHRWVRESLVSYPCRPNICNLDAHQERQGRGEVWPGALADAPDMERVTKKPRLSKDDMLYRLRWVTLGYHYDWNTKEYYSHCRSPFPEDLAELSKFILEVAGFPGFVPEAAIVNYYHLDSTLSGHTDHSERDLSLPLLSISFGLSAVFLVGGRTRAVRPKSILLNSGDVIVMSGDSRLAYHGVPRVLPPPDGSQLVPGSLSLESLRQCRAMERMRVSMEDGRRICCVCGRVWREDEIRRDTDSQMTTLNFHESRAEASQLHPSPASSEHNTLSVARHESSTAGRWCEEGTDSQGDCPPCLELLHTWPMFISYLSVSRININIRQVVSNTTTFNS